jgi:hypothetical protein
MMFVGSGYVLIPLLNHVIVAKQQWLKLRELDGVALSR